ncbi:hypothetical protein T07_642 [Trichinella nelsoni]|uniref:Uncharacterized protein n=1 Tax=Trichinella nelsoni TaxID=6336 RepID=A0A0V0RFY1_9BILA|nr:hypothetical protein T07_13847 [Trichinella nelsoni]KRX13411.1 hypothetical protein T07_642 [Trichinella nelsoni]
MNSSNCNAFTAGEAVLFCYCNEKPVNAVESPAHTRTVMGLANFEECSSLALNTVLWNRHESNSETEGCASIWETVSFGIRNA